MSNAPLISVIVPAYNIEKYIVKCLDSIVNQTYHNLEIIVVDDGSEDDTGVIIDKYVEEWNSNDKCTQNDVRIKVIHQENRGLSGARNSALKIATGEYIGYVDGDDTIESDMYEKMLTACIENNAELAVCAYSCVDEEGNLLGERKRAISEIASESSAESADSKEKVYVLPRMEALTTYLSDNKPYHIYNSVWSKLFKRSIVDGIEFPEGHNSEDIMYTAKALCNCNTCVFVDRPLYNYVQSRPDSIMNVSQKLADRRFNDELPFWKEQIVYFKSQGLDDIAEIAKYYLTRRELFYYIDFKNRKMTDAAKKLAGMILNNREEILKNYESDFVSSGDKSRLKLFLKNPNTYYFVNNLYEKIVVPIRNH